MSIGLKECSKCNGTGHVKSVMGLQVECECVKRARELQAKKKEVVPIEPITDIGEAVKKKAVALGYIPEHRIEDDFDIDVLVKNIEQLIGTKGQYGINVENLIAYKGLIGEILTGLRINQMPSRSHIIGATNGFGKTTFVNTAIKIMMAYDRNVVPYKSLYEISEMMYRDYDITYKRIERADDESELDRLAYDCTWKDVVNADLLFCYLSGLDDKCMWIEMSTLKRLLQLRGNKGKATIVLTEDSLDWYWNNEDVRKYIMELIMEPKNNKVDRYDKLKHTSVYVYSKDEVVKNLV